MTISRTIARPMNDKHRHAYLVTVACFGACWVMIVVAAIINGVQ